eukprot:TRINITY_DN16029_c0_g1_i1.p1 TRINITY_DN16029_c0_g1~~TRINITY_DN16029_c0_g1_i1.p1  ORF type:complete len:383 (-),score=47.78 TRINITY_DN16029_c0_g1_i1:76-1197(-)
MHAHTTDQPNGPQETTTTESDGNENQNPVHLLVLVHGFIGHYTQMNYLEKRIKQIYKDEIYVLKSSCNSTSFFSTNDGIDVGGTRLDQEIREIVNKYPSLKDFSILGNSLGGLYARYCLGLIFSGPDPIPLKPKLFVTTVCPHLGVRETLYPKVKLGFVLNIYKNLHRSGLQLMLADKAHQNNNKPLLLEMSEPESEYMKALAQFEHRILFANYLHDNIVPYCTAAIVPYQPTINDVAELKPVSDKHPHIIGIHEDPEGFDVESLAEGKPIFFTPDSHEATMLLNLRRLSWKRVDVLFDGPEGDPHDSLILANGRLDARDIIDFMILQFFPSCGDNFAETLEKEVEDYVHFDAKPVAFKIAKSFVDNLKSFFH